MTAPTTTMRIDEDVKRRAKPILEELGLNVSSATNIFLRAVVRCNGLPFDLRLSEGASTAAEDFVAEYLAPLMSERNAINRAGYDPERLRQRLIRKGEVINRGRRSIP